MSIFSGPAGKGAMREHRADKQREAHDRNRANLVLLTCGHATALDPDEHAQRCGAIA